MSHHLTDTAAVRRHFRRESLAHQQTMVGLRRDLHMFPELGYQEHSTADTVASYLDVAGFRVRRQVGGTTGVIADWGPEDAPKIAIRADMDGLPIQEETGVTYASKHLGIMHACGHDGHMAMVLVAAKMLVELLNQHPGMLSFGVRVIMQPAEEVGDAEGVSGAPRMIENGALDGVVAVIGLHLLSGVPAGQVVVMEGPMMSAYDAFEIMVTGPGGHGAYPEGILNPVLLAAQIALNIEKCAQTVCSDGGCLSVCSLASTTSSADAEPRLSLSPNVIPGRAVLSGTIRSFDPLVRQELRTRLQESCATVQSQVESQGGGCSLRWTDSSPAVINDSALTRVVRQVVSALLGEETLLDMAPARASEDFAHYGLHRPSVFVLLGAEPEDGLREHHSPDFNFNESVLWKGAAILATAVWELAQALKDGALGAP